MRQTVSVSEVVRKGQGLDRHQPAGCGNYPHAQTETASETGNPSLSYGRKLLLQPRRGKDRRGEILGMGIARAGEALAAGIEEAKRKQKERTAYASLAETLGLDPKKVSKEQVQAALLKDQIMQARAERAQQIRSRSAMQNFFQGLLNQRQAPAPATSADRAAAGLLGVNPDEQGSRGAGGDAGRTGGRLARAAKQPGNAGRARRGTVRPGHYQEPFDAAKTPTFGTTPGGRFMAIEPTGGVRFEPNPPAAKPATPEVPSDWQPPVKEIGGVKFDQEKPGGTWKTMPTPEQRTGGQPEMSADGKFYRTSLLDAWKPVPHGQSMEEFLKVFGEERQPTTTVLRRATSTNAATTINSQDDHDKLDSGAKYYDPDGNLRTKSETSSTHCALWRTGQEIIMAWSPPESDTIVAPAAKGRTAARAWSPPADDLIVTARSRPVLDAYQAQLAETGLVDPMTESFESWQARRPASEHEHFLTGEFLPLSRWDLIKHKLLDVFPGARKGYLEGAEPSAGEVMSELPMLLPMAMPEKLAVPLFTYFTAKHSRGPAGDCRTGLSRNQAQGLFRSATRGHRGRAATGDHRGRGARRRRGETRNPNGEIRTRVHAASDG